jgi:hypothetical protein
VDFYASDLVAEAIQSPRDAICDCRFELGVSFDLTVGADLNEQEAASSTE